MKKKKVLFYFLALSMMLNSGSIGFSETKKDEAPVVKMEQEAMPVYSDGRFPGFSSDFRIVDKEKNQRQGSMTVVGIKDGKIANMRTRYLNGKQLMRDAYPEYLKEYEQAIIEKGLDKVGELEGHEEEGRIVRSLVEDALRRSAGYEKEFRQTYQKSENLNDGTYIGKHNGFYPMEEFMVKVVVKDNVIEEVQLLNKADDNYVHGDKYFGNGKFINDMKGRSDAGTDVVAGATFSSRGVHRAVESALQQAKGYTDLRFPGFSPDYMNVDKEKEVSSVAVKDGRFQRNGTFVMVNIKDSKIDSVSVRVVDGKVIDRKNYTAETEYIKALQEEIKEKGIENVQPMKGHEKESEMIIAAVVDALIRSANFEKEFESVLDKEKRLTLGIYEGEHNGFYPMEKFKVKVEVRNGKIFKIDILEHADDNYIRVDKNEKAETAKKFKEMVKSLEGRSDAKVDTVAGATFSSKGFQAAVEDALKKAQ